MTITDIEYLVLISIFLVLFAIGLKRTDIRPLWGVDLKTTNALKGLACVFILMGHYGQRRFDLEVLPWGVSKCVWLTSASIALTWFMYFSGYGLSLKSDRSTPIVSQWLKRIKKIYVPLLLVCVVTTILYCFLPDIYTEEEYSRLWLSSDIHYLHHIEQSTFPTIVLHTLGWRDWYVCCILIFYSFFYLSQFLAEKTKIDQTPILWLFLSIYFVWAYYYFGEPEAHWYRYCWVFFGGHIHARWKGWNRNQKYVNSTLFILLASTMILQGKVMIIVYALAIIGLFVAIIINQKYTIDNKALVFMGSISYVFYLSHTRIGYHILAYVGVYSVLLWVVITICCSFLINKIYKYIN